MKANRRVRVLAGSLGVLLSLSAVAAETDTFAAAAQDSDSLETVVVTANRRAENLQDIPIAVTALSGMNLTSSGVNSLVDMGAVVPGLIVTQNDGFVNTHLRGVGSSIIGPGLENPIAIYVDGVYYASSSGALLDFVDVADVQVLKGPQGTLFGRNATGGLIQITTRTPGQDFHLDADLSYGNYQRSRADLYVAGGITEKLAADFAVQIKHQGEGYGRNFALGKDVYQEDFDGTARTKWIYSPADGTKITGILDYSRTRSSDNALSLNPGSIATPASETYRFHSAWDTNTDIQPLIKTEGGGASIHLDQDVGFARLSDIVAFRRSSTTLDFDLDFTPLAEEGAYLYDHERQFSEELQLQSQANSRIKWAAGIYYFDANGTYAPPSEVTLGTSQGIGLVGEEKTKSIAAYTQATTEIVSDTNLTLGFRYTHEDRDLIASQTFLVGGIPVQDLPGADTSKSFQRPTYRVAVDHRFTDEFLVYASFNTGFKSGGFNTQVPTDPPFSPELLKAYEVGAKTDLLDRRLRANMSAFYYDYKDIQEQHLELTSSGVINGPPGHIYGLDVDLQARLTNALRVGAGLEYLRGRFAGSFPELSIGTPAGNVPLVTGSVDGNRLPWTPDAVANLTLDYTRSMFGGQTSANVTYVYDTGFYTEPDNVIHQPGFGKLNLSLRWSSADSRYSVSLWGNNMTNKAVLGAGESAVNGSQYVQFEAPRTYGVTVGFHY